MAVETVESQIDTFLERSRDLTGKEVRERESWNTVASRDAIRHYAFGTSDGNPLWLDPDYAASERRTLSIAGRAINTMLATSGRNDVLRTYFVTQRDKVDYNLAYIGPDFSAPKSGEFDQSYMRALYAYGERQAASGQEWHKTPPGLEGDQ